MPLDAALAAQDIFTEHGRKVAEELPSCSAPRCGRPTRRAAPPPTQLRELVERFKPVTVQALVTAYESAVNETKRETINRRAR